MLTGQAYTFEGSFGGQGFLNAASESESMDIADASDGSSTVIVAMPTTNGGNGDGNGDTGSVDPADSQVPGAKVRIELSANAVAAIPAGDDFTVNLKGFSLPDSISNNAVLIDNTGYSGSPSEVVVGSNGVVTISLYSRWPGGAPAEAIQGAYTVTFKQSAGIKNPAAAGDIKITVTDKDGAEDAVTHKVQRVINLSKTSGTRGTMITATFKGFANGSATVNLNGSKLAEVTIADNIGTHEIDTTSSSFKANEDNTITAEDAAGESSRPAMAPCSPSNRRQWLIPKSLLYPKTSLSSFRTGRLT